MSFKLLETMRFQPEQGFDLLDRHLTRMEKSACYFGFQFSRLEVENKLESASNKWDEVKRVRLLVDRSGIIDIEHRPISIQPPLSLKVSLARKPVDKNNIFLFHKTTNRDSYEAALADHKDADDVILYNEHGEITESCIANIAIKVQGSWITPPVTCGLLAGTKRAELIDNRQLTEQIFFREDLMQAQEVKLFNSIRGEYLVKLRLHSGQI